MKFIVLSILNRKSPYRQLLRIAIDLQTPQTEYEYTLTKDNIIMSGKDIKNFSFHPKRDDIIAVNCRTSLHLFFLNRPFFTQIIGKDNISKHSIIYCNIYLAFLIAIHKPTGFDKSIETIRDNIEKLKKYDNKPKIAQAHYYCGRLFAEYGKKENRYR